jgi:hypothetical protein
MTAALAMALVADEDLQRLAAENGPASAEAQALAQLKSQRSQDLQVHCYRVDDTCRHLLGGGVVADGLPSHPPSR